MCVCVCVFAYSLPDSQSLFSRLLYHDWGICIIGEELHWLGGYSCTTTAAFDHNILNFFVHGTINLSHHDMAKWIRMGDGESGCDIDGPYG